MAIKRRADSAVVLFDVLYADGTRSSNRKVPAGLIGGLDGDEPAKAFIEAQDREIGEASGRPRPAIRSLARAAVKPAPAEPPKKKAESPKKKSVRG